ncbi:MAG: hypothetical protein J6Q22_21735 [Prevotella sp.]|jgi:hypothetical protein|nr:hypothetical protein [Prevotella sp.]
MFEGEYMTVVIAVLLVTILVVMASVAIPIIGYQRKRWKGVAIGCIMQPVVCGVFFCVLLAGAVIYRLISNNNQRQSMMVTVRTTEPGAYGVDTLEWYLKPDDECFVDYRRLEKTSSTESDSLNIHKYTNCFDIIRLDSLNTSVCVEDRIVIRFDLQNQKATATDYDQPIEVVDIDWDKVKAYFNK